MSLNKSFRPSLPNKLKQADQYINLSFGALIFTLMIIVLGAGMAYVWDVMDSEEDRLSQLVTELMAKSVSKISFSGKYHTRLLLEEMVREQANLSYILLANPQGQILAHSDPSQNDKKLPPSTITFIAKILTNTTSYTRYLQHQNQSIREITLVYKSGYNNSKTGIIQVGISTQKRDESLMQGLFSIALLVFCLLFLGIFITKKISSFFGNSVKELANDMSATLNAIPDLLFEMDQDGRYLQVLCHNSDFSLKYRQELLGKTVLEVLPTAAAQTILNALQVAEVEGESHGHQIMLLRNQLESWFELSVAKKNAGQHKQSSFIVLSRNITQRKQAEKDIYLYANVFKYSGEAILISDSANRIISCNPAFISMTGYNFDEIQGKNPKMLGSGQTPPQTYQEMWSALNHNGYWQGELWDRDKNGSVYPKWAAISLIKNDAGIVTHHLASFTDITERKATEKQLYHLAHFDALTNLLNRFSLESRLEQALLSSQRKNEHVAVMFIDMDRFKDINDTLGHHIGDDFLVEIAQRLLNCVRESDIVARLGGDEFVIVLTTIETDLIAGNIATSVLHSLSQPYNIEGHELHSSTSIGISLFPLDGKDSEQLMKCADTAMYHAKENGRNNYQFFSQAMTTRAENRTHLEADMRIALETGQFQLYYQPQICANSNRLSGVEALIRWNHPENGMISPVAFIPVAEDCGLIEAIGSWVLDEACRQLACWQAVGLDSIKMSVNLSAHQLKSSQLIEIVESTLKKHAIKGTDLELEITETVAMQDPEKAIKTLETLRALGIFLAIDDFGTGYSSLAYLKRLPIHTLKIDREFIRDIENDQNDASISSATIGLAHNLGLKVVAEGVETAGQRDLLLANKCDIFQGYFYGKPMPADELLAFWKKNPS